MNEVSHGAAQGMFITLEGVEGAGKTTQMAHLQSVLATAGRPVRQTREPGGTRIGELVRAILLNPDVTDMTPDAELLLMFAARAQHLSQVIRPCLSDGDWVICDRFTDASFAYQGNGRGVDWQRIEVLENWVQDSLRPDLCLVLDLPVETGLARVAKRGGKDRFEREHVDFFARVRDGYLERARRAPERYAVIDADRSADRVSAEIESVINSRLSDW